MPALVALIFGLATDARAASLDAGVARAEAGAVDAIASQGKSKKSKGKKSKKSKSKSKKGNKGNKGTGNKGSDEAASGAAEDGAIASEGAQADGPSVPEPDPAPPSLEVQLPVKVKGKLPKSSQGRLIGRLEAAVAGVSVEGGPYRVRMTVGLAKKDNYTLTLTVKGANGKTVAEVSEPCKGCSVSQAGDKVAALVPLAVTRITERANAPGEVTVASVPPGATVSVDGEERGPAPQVLELSPGEHTVVVTKDGFVEQRQTVVVEPEGTQQLELSLEAAPVPPGKKGKKDKKSKKDKKDKGKKDKVVDTGPKAGKPWTIAGGVMMGLGLGSILTGVALILVDEDPIPSQCEGDQVDFRGVCRVRYNTLGSGIIAVTVGALGVGGGIALMVKGRQVTVRARASKTQATLGVRVRF
ncbi:MAG: PEGA domain-containing protein [Myxococcota bacterium]